MKSASFVFADQGNRRFKNPTFRNIEARYVKTGAGLRAISIQPEFVLQCRTEDTGEPPASRAGPNGRASPMAPEWPSPTNVRMRAALKFEVLQIVMRGFRKSFAVLRQAESDCIQIRVLPSIQTAWDQFQCVGQLGDLHVQLRQVSCLNQPAMQDEKEPPIKFVSKGRAFIPAFLHPSSFRFTFSQSDTAASRCG